MRNTMNDVDSGSSRMIGMSLPTGSISNETCSKHGDVFQMTYGCIVRKLRIALGQMPPISGFKEPFGLTRFVHSFDFERSVHRA